MSLIKPRTAPRRTNNSAIARLRIERGITQAQLAKQLGTVQTTVAKWETGKQKPGLRSLLALANALGCTIDDLAKNE